MGQRHSKVAQEEKSTTHALTWMQPDRNGLPPTPRNGHTADLIEAKLYIFGGGDRWDCEHFSLANVPDGSPLLWFPLLACYCITLAALKLLYDEQQVYTPMRHCYLKEDRVENYTIMLRDLRPENQTTERLRSYFERMYSRTRSLRHTKDCDQIFAVTVVTDCKALLALQKKAAGIRGPQPA